jgi:hypothetical protein
MLPRIISIVKVLPFKVSANWNTGELREIDFLPILSPYKNKPDSSLGQLLRTEIFEKVKLDPESQTLYWEGLIKMRLQNGTFVPAPLDFCPDVLFENSRVVEKPGI